MSAEAAASGKKMKVWWGSGSVPCMKVIMVMAELGLWETCDKKQISFSDKEHKGEDVLKQNPRGQVPTFTDEDGSIVVNESTAICQYLNENYAGKENNLIPQDKKLKAQVLQRMFEIPNISMNVMLPLIYYKMRNKKEDWDYGYLKEKAESAGVEFSRWNTYLEGKSFLVGDKFTMADVFLFNDMLFMARQGLPMEKLYPNLYKYVNAIKARQSAIASEPPHWKEGAGPLMLKDFPDFPKPE